MALKPRSRESTGRGRLRGGKGREGCFHWTSGQAREAGYGSQYKRRWQAGSDRKKDEFLVLKTTCYLLSGGGGWAHVPRAICEEQEKGGRRKNRARKERGGRGKEGKREG